jgi:hypothetical protein
MDDTIALVIRRESKSVTKTFIVQDASDRGL